MKSVTCRLCVSLFFVLISSAFMFSQDKMSDMKSTIMKWNEKFEKAMVEGDNETILSFYADDAISFLSYFLMIKGKDAIKAGMMMDNSGNRMKAFKLNTTDLFQSGDMMYEIGNYELTMEMKGMDQPYNDHGKYLTIYEKQNDGSWKIKADMWNTDTNPWSMMKQTSDEKK